MTTDIVDEKMLRELLELDTPGTHDFSEELLNAFKTQAEVKLESLRNLLLEENLSELAKVAHFLKGSAASVGALKFRNTCEMIQFNGELGNNTLSFDDALRNAKILTLKLIEDYKEWKLNVPLAVQKLSQSI